MRYPNGSLLEKLQEEVREVIEATSVENYKEECADVAIVLYAIAEKGGWSLEEEILKKMYKNLAKENGYEKDLND